MEFAHGCCLKYHIPLPQSLDAALADELGGVDAISKAAEGEFKELKDEFRAWGFKAATGDGFTVTACEMISGRLDVKAIRNFLGAAVSRFEVAQITNVIRVKATALRSRSPRNHSPVTVPSSDNGGEPSQG